MSDIADTLLAQRLSQISGVGRVSVLGGLKPAVRMQADLARLAAYGIAMEDLRTAIAGANVSGPKGSLDGAQQSYTIAANDQIAAADAYKPIIIAYRNGAPVTIGDVAQIVDGLENDRTGGWYQGTPAVIIDIQRQPGANVIEVVQPDPGGDPASCSARFRPASTSPSSATAPSPSAPPCMTCSSR